MRIRWHRRLLAHLLLLVAACGGVQARPPETVMAEIQASELRLAKEAMARSELTEAARRLEGLARSLPPTDPTGLEARSLLARIDFELGDYASAVSIAADARAAGATTPDLVEVQALTQMYQCDFDAAAAELFGLAQMEEPRGRVWLGVLAAWQGHDANAEAELSEVSRRFGATEFGPLARFYLLQLYLWGNRTSEARSMLSELEQAHPGYLDDLAGRAGNWLTRRVHLLRAYFTFDTLARAAVLEREGEVAAADRATAALSELGRVPGRCEPHVRRLLEVQTTWRASLVAAAPPPDADGDRIVDAADACPAQPETWNGVADDDGCPDRAAVFVRGSQIVISEGFAVNFETGSDVILPESQPVIDAVVHVMRSPQFSYIRKIRIAGHTDDVGDESANFDLSVRRAASVVHALEARGVPADRIDGVGYGEKRPVIYGTDDAARAKNRRVEIFVVDPPSFGAARGGRSSVLEPGHRDADAPSLADRGRGREPDGALRRSALVGFGR